MTISHPLHSLQTTGEIRTNEDGSIRILTGVPQVDWVSDPNLPRELNGYNLSKYPFLDSVPDSSEMEFKCDDKLKDGFYADVQYGCQVNYIYFFFFNFALQLCSCFFCITTITG